MPTVKDQAIGSWEAASVMGVHFTQPAVMVRKGLLKSRKLKSQTSSGGDRTFVIYSLNDCNADYADYEDTQATRTRRRPRSYLENRPAEIKRLKGLKNQVAYEDAIGAAEAAEIMGCHWTWPPRAARNGDIIGRILHNGRTDKVEDRAWIFSRRSCEENAAKAKAEIHAGTKIGRPRRGIKRKTLAS